MKHLFYLMLMAALMTGTAVASKKKTPEKTPEATVKMVTGELQGKIQTDKKDFKVYVFVANDKKIWSISASSVDKVKKFYGRSVKIKATYKAGSTHIENIESIGR